MGLQPLFCPRRQKPRIANVMQGDGSTKRSSDFLNRLDVRKFVCLFRDIHCGPCFRPVLRVQFTDDKSYGTSWQKSCDEYEENCQYGVVRECLWCKEAGLP